MRNLRALARPLALLPLLVTPVMAQEAPPSDQQVIQQAIEDVFRPGFAAFDAAAAALESDTARLCAGPTAALFSAARAQFRETVAAWSRVELYRIGPLLEDNRSERVLFWPDRKGTGLRQVQAALATEDGTATSRDTLTQKSVALQGFGALEFVLFGTGSDVLADTAGYRCDFAQAIAGAIHQVATQLDAAWADPDGISKRLLQPTESDAEFRTTREVMEELTGLLAHGAEIVRDQRLLPFLGRDGAKSKPKSALFWRSGLTLTSIAANFEGLETLFDRSEVGETGAENAWVANGISFEFANAARALAAVDAPVAEAVADPGQKQALAYLVIVTQSLDDLLGESLAAARGLSVGFSSLDGD